MENVFQQVWEALVNLVDGDMTDADLAAKLDETAEGRNLNWRASVVDFLALVGVDSSSENREALGFELGVIGTPKTAAFNEALRRALFAKIADSGGNVPASLLD